MSENNCLASPAPVLALSTGRKYRRFPLTSPILDNRVRKFCSKSHKQPFCKAIPGRRSATSQHNEAHLSLTPRTMGLTLRPMTLTLTLQHRYRPSRCSGTKKAVRQLTWPISRKRWFTRSVSEKRCLTNAGVPLHLRPLVGYFCPTQARAASQSASTLSTTALTSASGRSENDGSFWIALPAIDTPSPKNPTIVSYGGSCRYRNSCLPCLAMIAVSWLCVNPHRKP